MPTIVGHEVGPVENKILPGSTVMTIPAVSLNGVLINRCIQLVRLEAFTVHYDQNCSIRADL